MAPRAEVSRNVLIIEFHLGFNEIFSETVRKKSTVLNTAGETKNVTQFLSFRMS